ncbi:MAG: lipid-A-disaccharide synthase [Cyanobacteriota bacterium]
MTKRLFIVTGEPSGDIHASYVIKELKKLINEIEISGVGGLEMKELGVNLLYDHSDMAVVGLDSFKKIPHHIKMGSNIINYLNNDFKPDLVLLIDYGGFNLRLAKELKKFNHKVFYYISPQVWASRKGRLKKIKAYTDKMMLILPFEEPIHRGAGVNAEFVGHPLVSQLPERCPKETFCKENNLDPGKPLVGLFPGSRKMEISFLLETFINTALIMQQKCPEIQFCLAQSINISDNYINNILQNINPNNKLNLTILKNSNYKVLSASDFVILASGTVTLEATIYNTPMIISYKSYKIAYYLYLMLRYINKLGLPNIISGKDIVPEFLQKGAVPELMADTSLKLLHKSSERTTMINDLTNVRNLLTNNIASARVAEIIYNEIKIKRY